MIRNLREGEQIPEEFADVLKLAPEERKKLIILGDKRMWIFPPTKEEVDKIIDALKKYLLFQDNNEDVVDSILRDFVPSALKSIGINETILAKATPDQIIHVAYTVYDFIFGMEGLGEGIRKNVKSLWGTLRQMLSLTPEAEENMKTLSDHFSRTPEAAQRAMSAKPSDTPPPSSEEGITFGARILEIPVVDAKGKTGDDGVKTP